MIYNYKQRDMRGRILRWALMQSVWVLYAFYFFTFFPRCSPEVIRHTSAKSERSSALQLEECDGGVGRRRRHMCWYDVGAHFNRLQLQPCVLNFHRCRFGFSERRNNSEARCKNEQCDVFGLYFGTTVFLLIPLRDWKRKCLLIAPVSATRYE